MNRAEPSSSHFRTTTREGGPGISTDQPTLEQGPKLLPTESCSFCRVLSAPLVGIIYPRRAARIYVECGWAKFLLSQVLYALLITGSGILLVLWGLTLEVEWDGARWALTRKSFIEVWRSMHTESDYVVLSTAVFANLVLLAIALFVAWLLLPVAHRGGGVLASLARSFRIVCATTGWLWLVGVVFGCVMVFGYHADLIRFAGPEAPSFVWFSIRFNTATYGIVFMLLISHRFANYDLATSEIEPTSYCDDCGYDLSHTARDGRCPECGRSAASSFDPDVPRACNDWQRRRSPRSYVRTVCSAFESPRTFYQELRMRDGTVHAGSFWLVTMLSMGACAFPWSFLVLVLADEFDFWLHACLAVTSGVVFAGWMTHHFVGALVASVWIARRWMPVGSYVSRVFHYEAAFLPAFCVFNGTLIMLFMAFPELAPSLPGAKLAASWVGDPIAAIMLLGSGILIVVWIFRMHRALLRVRFSNV